jgi:hypothetical protein
MTASRIKVLLGVPADQVLGFEPGDRVEHLYTDLLGGNAVLLGNSIDDRPLFESGSREIEDG